MRVLVGLLVLPNTPLKYFDVKGVLRFDEEWYRVVSVTAYDEDGFFFDVELNEVEARSFFVFLNILL